MAWITIDDALIAQKFAGPEDTALRGAALKQGQADPTADVVASIVQEVRGYVGAYAGNALGEGDTIPAELLTAALNRIRFELASRLPVRSLLTDARVKANDAAVRLLEAAAAGRFAVEQPATASPQVMGGAGIQIVSKTTRKATREKLSGL